MMVGIGSFQWVMSWAMLLARTTLQREGGSDFCGGKRKRKNKKYSVEKFVRRVGDRVNVSYGGRVSRNPTIFALEEPSSKFIVHFWFYFHYHCPLSSSFAAWGFGLLIWLQITNITHEFCYFLACSYAYYYLNSVTLYFILLYLKLLFAFLLFGICQCPSYQPKLVGKQ